MKCKCEQEIPAARVNLGYRVCVQCSQEQAVSCVDIIYHKTGNTIQQCTKEQAEAIRKVSRRSGFGASAGMRAGSDPKPKVTLTRRAMPARARIATPMELDAIGRDIMSIIDSEGVERVPSRLQWYISGNLCTPAQARKIHQACMALHLSNSIEQ
jgi:hypothetical protein